MPYPLNGLHKPRRILSLAEQSLSLFCVYSCLSLRIFALYLVQPISYGIEQLCSLFYAPCILLHRIFSQNLVDPVGMLQHRVIALYVFFIQCTLQFAAQSLCFFFFWYTLYLNAQNAPCILPYKAFALYLLTLYVSLCVEYILLFFLNKTYLCG